MNFLLRVCSFHSEQKFCQTSNKAFHTQISTETFQGMINESYEEWLWLSDRKIRNASGLRRDE